MAKQARKAKSKNVESTMTVVNITPTKGKDSVTVIFTPSQRFYKMRIKSNAKYLALLEASKRDKTLVTIVRADEKSDVILSVSKPKNR
jgi:hypothetical protein